MAMPIDPRLRRGTPPATVPVQAPDLCAWCFGSGSILEPMDCGTAHVYLPVVCTPCEGTGRRRDA